MVLYKLPAKRIADDPQAVANALTNARASVLSLKTIPYQRGWLEALQKAELKRDVAGTSRIEGVPELRLSNKCLR